MVLAPFVIFFALRSRSWPSAAGVCLREAATGRKPPSYLAAATTSPVSLPLTHFLLTFACLTLQLFPISFCSVLIIAPLSRFSPSPPFSPDALPVPLTSLPAPRSALLQLGASGAGDGASVPQQHREEPPRLMCCQQATPTATIITRYKDLQAAIRSFREACRSELVCLWEGWTPNPVPLLEQTAALFRWVSSSRLGNACAGQFRSHRSLPTLLQHCSSLRTPEKSTWLFLGYWFVVGRQPSSW